MGAGRDPRECPQPSRSLWFVSARVFSSPCSRHSRLLHVQLPPGISWHHWRAATRCPLSPQPPPPRFNRPRTRRSVAHTRAPDPHSGVFVTTGNGSRGGAGAHQRRRRGEVGHAAKAGRAGGRDRQAGRGRAGSATRGGRRLASERQGQGAAFEGVERTRGGGVQARLHPYQTPIATRAGVVAAWASCLLPPLPPPQLPARLARRVRPCPQRGTAAS